MRVVWCRQSYADNYVEDNFAVHIMEEGREKEGREGWRKKREGWGRGEGEAGKLYSFAMATGRCV